MVSTPVIGFSGKALFGQLKDHLKDVGYNAHLLKDINCDPKSDDFFEKYYSGTTKRIKELGKHITLVGCSSSGEICLEAASRVPNLVDKIILFDSHLHIGKYDEKGKKEYKTIIKVTKAVHYLSKICPPLKKWFQGKMLKSFESEKAAFRVDVAEKELSAAGYNSTKANENLQTLIDEFNATKLSYFADSLSAWHNEMERFDYESIRRKFLMIHN